LRAHQGKRRARHNESMFAAMRILTVWR
jgi:hypothetical protein